MNHTEKRETASALATVIAWELECQASVNRSPEELPGLLADSILDYFDVTRLPGAVLPGRDR